ncbi:hypothetical protein C8R45DRAFT_631715 [Mycena sanguinolenta]|nr:hypothetical protein C8R45DRAFT_631715 [Mycena sanguinolenta]
MTTNVAIVDDSSPLVHYSGTWVSAGAPLEFNSTTKVSQVQGVTASITFEGTSIAVFGTVALVNPPDSSLDFVVDNSITGTYTPPANMTTGVHHEQLWMSPSLTNGTHTLTITQTQAQQAGVIYLDYFLYNTTSTSVESYFIDDTDSRIQYSAGWNQVATEADFGQSLHGSSAAGDSFSLQFEGKSISMWGAINNGSTGQVLNASLVIDNGPPVFFVPPIQTAVLTHNNLIFDSGELSNGAHTLLVTAENNYTVWMDYFLITPATATAATTSAPASTSSSHSSASLPIAAVIGAAVGAVVLLVIVAGTLFFLRRRKTSADTGTCTIHSFAFRSADAVCAIRRIFANSIHVESSLHFASGGQLDILRVSLFRHAIDV